MLWRFDQANWHELERELRSINWSMLDKLDPDSAAEWVTDQILEAMEDNIPKTKSRTRKKTPIRGCAKKSWTRLKLNTKLLAL